MFFLFFSCSAIEAVTLIATLHSVYQGVYNFSALQMLITAVIGQVVAFAIYSIKSLKQNTKGGIVYEATLARQEETEFNNIDIQEVQG